MPTVINNPPPTNNSSNMMGIIVGSVIVLVLGYLFIFYAIPAIRNMGTPQINVPSEIDVNINQTGQ